MEIIPAIDIINGKCVRLTQGDFSRQKTYLESPLEAAKQFKSVGLKRLHIVDLDGAKRGSPKNLEILESIASETNLTIDFGGGIKSDRDVKRVFDAGADMISVGSTAVREPDTFFEWLEHYGRENFLLGADVRDGKISVDGWQTDTEIDLLPFLAEYNANGVEQAFVTDIRKDGELEGPAFRLYQEIRHSVPELKLIASGGVSSIKDIEELEMIGCAGVIVGKAIYEGRINLKELSKHVSETHYSLP
ncbi:MAG TPA: 1-(5-phosphoribosyl)-5-[(5-phosphoribosylamino)methylideneamino]imidazole-4-carboxamide isomerase [Pyrinomonadaceae bacterium]|nr:1-(5-phosphoribosyl)-5-[(5-phosphoribosylamino)methylideneamino]imidazole-4-carboxamide isomerase [Pyrinomonadaceae bacterium]